MDAYYHIGTPAGDSPSANWLNTVTRKAGVHNDLQAMRIAARIAADADGFATLPVYADASGERVADAIGAPRATAYR